MSLLLAGFPLSYYLFLDETNKKRPFHLTIRKQIISSVYTFQDIYGFMALSCLIPSIYSLCFFLLIHSIYIYENDKSVFQFSSRIRLTFFQWIAFLFSVCLYMKTFLTLGILFLYSCGILIVIYKFEKNSIQRHEK